MAYSNPEVKKFPGLFLEANSFEVPDGAMEKATNIVIQDDDTAQKIRCFYEYYSGGGLTPNTLVNYKGKLLAVFSDRISYFTDTGSSPNETGTKSDLSGETIAVTGTRIARTLEQSGNLYTTTDNGVVKIDDYNATVYKAGSPPALDLRGNFDPANGVFAGDSQTAYRVVFGRRDANDNLLLGAPSDILVLTNSLVVAAPFTNPSANLVEVTLAGHNLKAGMTIQITAATGDTALVATQTIVSSGLTTSAFRFDKGAAVTAPGTVTFKVTRTPRVEFTVPREITSTTPKWFYRVYRAGQSTADSVSPEANFRKIDEQYLSSAQITAGLVVYSDVIDEVLLTYAEELYTNPNSGEGESQANTRPPKCDDVAVFQGCAFYAKCTTRHTIELDVVDPSQMAAGDFFYVKVDALTRQYIARIGVGNSTTKAESASNVGTTVTVNYTAHGLSAGDFVYVSNATAATNAPSGQYALATAAANSFTFTAASIATGLTGLDFQGVKDSTGLYMFLLDKTSSSIATRLRNTARGLIKAINRDPSAVVYGNYISGITDIPGKMRFTAVGFGGAMYFKVSSGSTAFSPVLPTDYAVGDQVYSRNDNQPNMVYVSKYQEPEAAPLANALAAGSKNSDILRIKALRNSVLVIKTDGVYKITGDSPRNFTVTPLDLTVFCVAANSVAVANNTVFLLANLGVCAATDSGVRIVSGNIKRVIQPIVGRSTVSAQTAGAGYDSDGTYRISTLGPNDTTKTVSWIYNFLNETWTDSDYLFSGGLVGPNDTLYQISPAGQILKERKNQNRLDYCGQNYAATVVSVAADKLSAVVTVTGYTPVVGDVIVKGSVIVHLETVAPSGSDFLVTFATATSLLAADSVVVYAKVRSSIQFAPFHAGAVGREKQFAQLALSTRDNGVYRMKVSFSTNYFGASEETNWSRADVSQSGGFGEFPFGFEPFGQEDGLNSPTTTLPGPPIRLYVPQFAQRGTFIRVILEHNEACDPINLQALTWSIRGYGERTSK